MFSVLRGAIYYHGLAKLKSDPGLCQLSETAVADYKAQRKLKETNLPLILVFRG